MDNKPKNVDSKPKIAAVINALNQLEVKGKVNATYLVAAINTLESIIKEDEPDGNLHSES